MRVIGTIRSTATETITVDAETYEAGRGRLDQELPDGFKIIHIRVER